MMSINHIGSEEIGRRKISSDIKNDTDNLTFEDSKSGNKNAAAYRGVREYKDNKLLRELQDDFNEIFLD